MSFTDTFGAPRGGGRRHKGNDLFAPGGTPFVAVTDGSVFFQGDPLGGNAAYVQGNDGNTYYYAHLNDYVGGARSVTAGELIGHVGNTGDAAGGPTHLHFEIRPGRSERPGDRPVPDVGGPLWLTTGRVSGPIARACERVIPTERIQRLLDPAFVAALDPARSTTLRIDEGGCNEVENALSYRRRLAQARIEILEAEHERRARGGTVEDLVKDLPRILSAESGRSSITDTRVPPPDAPVSSCTGPTAASS